MTEREQIYEIIAIALNNIRMAYADECAADFEETVDGVQKIRAGAEILYEAVSDELLAQLHDPLPPLSTVKVPT
jgi:hypothetical protein